MTKKELEQKIFQLEGRIIALESRPICGGHYQYTFPNPITPVTPSFPPTSPVWATISTGPNSFADGTATIHKGSVISHDGITHAG